jgi:hypothetical protein
MATLLDSPSVGTPGPSASAKLQIFSGCSRSRAREILMSLILIAATLFIGNLVIRAIEHLFHPISLTVRLGVVGAALSVIYGLSSLWSP